MLFYVLVGFAAFSLGVFVTMLIGLVTFHYWFRWLLRRPLSSSAEAAAASESLFRFGKRSMLSRRNHPIPLDSSSAMSDASSSEAEAEKEKTKEGTEALGGEQGKKEEEDEDDEQTLPYEKLEGYLSVALEYNDALPDTKLSMILNLLNSGGDSQKNQHWMVLQRNMLYVYDRPGEKCLDKILLDGISVKHHPKYLLDNEIWLPRFPLKIEHPSRTLWANSSVLYVYSKLGIAKESWYHALRLASIIGNPEFRRKEYLEKLQLQNNNSVLLNDFNVSSIPESDRWFNVMFGRLFWSPNHEQGLKDFFWRKLDQKMQRKLSRKGTSSFLQDVHVKDMFIGAHSPLLHNARILSLTKDGSMVADAELIYNGGFSVTVEATLVLDLFLQRRYKLALSVTVGVCSGKVQLQIKAPPTSCFWLGFYKFPRLELLIDPVVQDTSVKSNRVKQIIEKLIRDAIDDCMVLPNLDDYPLPYINEDGAELEPTAVHVQMAAPDELDGFESISEADAHDATGNEASFNNGGASGTGTSPREESSGPRRRQRSFDTATKKTRHSWSVANTTDDLEAIRQEARRSSSNSVISSATTSTNGDATSAASSSK